MKLGIVIKLFDIDSFLLHHFRKHVYLIVFRHVMKEKFFKEGDQQAGQRLADLAGFRQMMETSCKHNWETDGTGHYYCTKCGADGGSAWDC